MISGNRPIYLITFPPNRSFNYGGVLQSWALQQVITKLNPDSIVITEKLSFLYIIKMHFFKLFPNKFLLLPTRFSRTLQRLKYWKFRFMGEELLRQFVNAEIVTEDLMSANHQVAGGDWLNQNSVFVFGSDQIWRKDYGNFPTFFGDFIPISSPAKMIAYSCSFGGKESEYTSDELSFLKTLLGRFNSVSVREPSACSFITNNLLLTDCKVMPDPTLLLDKQQYLDLIIEKPQLRTKFFFYLLSNSSFAQAAYLTLVKQVGELKNIRVILGPEFSAPGELIDVIENRDADMLEWLSQFRDAECVITDSYHGAILSIIFHKSFICIGNEDRGTERLEHLLNFLDLSDRLVKSDSDFTFNYNLKIDWFKVENKICQAREHGIAFLTRALDIE